MKSDGCCCCRFPIVCHRQITNDAPAGSLFMISCLVAVLAFKRILAISQMNIRHILCLWKSRLFSVPFGSKCWFCFGLEYPCSCRSKFGYTKYKYVHLSCIPQDEWKRVIRLAYSINNMWMIYFLYPSCEDDCATRALCL